MENWIPVLFAAPTLLIIGILLSFWKSKQTDQADNCSLSLFTIIHTVIYFGISLWLIFAADLPITLFDNEYFYIDALSGYEILITTIVFLLVSLYGRGYVSGLIKAGDLDAIVLKFFYAAFCLLELLLVFGFMSNNIALLWIFIELSTIITAFLIVTLNARENILAALKYIFIASTAMIFGFIGIIILFTLSQKVIDGGSLNWTTLMDIAHSVDPSILSFAFIFLFIGFAAKSGLVPFHTWIPIAYARAPSIVAAVSGIVLNLGVYGILRLYAIGNLAGAGEFLKNFLLVIGLLTVIIAAFSILARTNTKKLLAFSSIESMGFMIVSIGIGAPVALFWMLFFQFTHSLVKTLLFFCAGIFRRQYKSNKFDMIKKPFQLQPLASWGLILGGAAIIGTPLFPIFLAKWNILSVLVSASFPAFVVLLVCFLLVAVGFVLFFIRAFNQKTEEEIQPYQVPSNMKVPIVITICLIIAMGLYIPSWLNNILLDISGILGF
ncbi:MAG: proton-conducting transporter membrane subunit [Dehalococcoidales bacterium]